MPFVLRDTTLSVHVLNVGDGDSIVVELPAEGGQREHVVVDCYSGKKTIGYLRALGATRLALVVGTHPHFDHIAGLEAVLRAYEGRVEQFWDSGFRHVSTTWSNLVSYVSGRSDILFLRPTSGLSTRIAGVDVTVLAPSVNLRNRYDTYGVNVNNASIVLRLAYEREGKKAAAVLAGDAQWDSWAKMTEEFPHFERTENPDRHIQIQKEYLPLKCDVLKVAHHGSKHGTALEAIERLRPKHGIISCARRSRHEFPHELATDALADLDTAILRTYEGSVVAAIEPGGPVVVGSLGEAKDAVPVPPPRA